MTYAAELAEVKQGRVRPIYLLYGEEVRLMRSFEKTVISALLSPEERTTNLLVLDQEPDLRELINQIETVPFLGGVNVIVVRNTRLFRNSRKNKAEMVDEEGDLAAEAAEELMEASVRAEDAGLIDVLENMPPYSHVIFAITCKLDKKTYKEIDKRRGLYKVVEKCGATVEIAPLQAAQVRDWLQEQLKQMGKRMNADALEHFLAVISLMPSISLGFLENELEKINLYTGDCKVITKQAVLAIMSAVPEASIFALIDAVNRKQVQAALDLLVQQLTAGVHPLIIVALLTRQVRMLWQTKDMVVAGNGAQEIARYFKLPSFVGEKLIKQSRSFSVETLKKAMIALAEADRDLKSGQADNSVFECLVINMCR